MPGVATGVDEVFLPIGDNCARYRTPYVTYGLIAANVLVHGYQLSLDEGPRFEFVWNYSSLSGSLSLIRSVTSGFLHADIVHLAGNMWFLFLFGSSVEGKLGHLWMGVTYLACLLVSDFAQHFLSPSAYELALGASGAVGGVIGAYWFLFSRCEVEFFYWLGWWWHGRVWLGVHWAVVWLFGWDALWWVLALKYGADTGVAHSAHLGGLICGFLCGLLIRKYSYVKLDGDDMLTRFTVWRLTGGKGPRRMPAQQARQAPGPHTAPRPSEAPAAPDPAAPPVKRSKHGVTELPFE